MRIAKIGLLVLVPSAHAIWIWDWVGRLFTGSSTPARLAKPIRVGGENHPIKTVVITVLENRSFDQLCGFFDYDPSIDGVKEKPFCNYLRANDNGSTPFCTNSKAMLYTPDNPSHVYDQITEQIYGTKTPGSDALPNMSGFIQERKAYIPRSKDADLQRLFECFEPSKIPILHTLAKEFVLFDRWFASIPTCTLPNRKFLHAHTAEGLLKNEAVTSVKGWTVKSIWDILDDYGVTWVNYWQEFPTLTLFKSLRSGHWNNYKFYNSHFKQDALAGQLPTVSFIDPIYGYLPYALGRNNDGHGPTDYSRTEILLKEMYETLRKSPQWDNLLWIITFDEHGGWADHVPPPSGVPSPDHHKAANGFAYDRLGGRVPTLLVSPWLKKGKVVHHEGSAPFPNSEYEHSSIGATLFKLLNINETLTHRTRWAKTFEFLFKDQNQPRTDCPETLPDIVYDESNQPQPDDDDAWEDHYSDWTRAEMMSDFLSLKRRSARFERFSGRPHVAPQVFGENQQEEALENQVYLDGFKEMLRGMTLQQRQEYIEKYM